jgi:hypothetical protein
MLTDTNRDLLARLTDLLRREHAALADFLVALAEFDRRRGWRDLGYAGLFPFLHRELHLSKPRPTSGRPPRNWSSGSPRLSTRSGMVASV